MRRHIGEARHSAQRRAADGHGDLGHEITAALRFDLCKVVVHDLLEDGRPMFGHRARAERGKQHLALGHMGRAIASHHVEAHDLFHQPARLHGGECRDALFLAVNGFTLGQQGRAQLGHICNGRVAAHGCQNGVGVSGEGRRINRDMGRI